MKRDAGSVPSGAILDFDVCVVGGGPAGLSLAQSLANSGWKVALLESGGEKPARKAPWDDGGKVVGLPYCRLRAPGRGGPGGSSWFWEYKDNYETPGMGGGFRSRPMDRIDFEKRDWVPNSGWPIPAGEVLRWYEAAHAVSGLVFEEYTGARWADDEHTPIEFGHGVENTVYQLGPPYNFQELAATVAGLPGGTVFHHAQVTALDEGESPADVVSVRVARPGGGGFRVQAREFVLAGGGIENPRMLLASTFGRPGQLANRNDLVGRYYLEHPYVETGELRDIRYDDPKLPFYRRHRALGGQIIGMFRVSDEVQRREGLLNAVCELQPRRQEFSSRGVRGVSELAWGLRHWSRPDGAVRHALNVVRDAPAVARAAAAKARGQLERDTTLPRLVFTMEQVPNRESRVTLGTARDEFGIPKPVLDWRITPIDSRSIRRTQDLLEVAFRDAGLGAISEKWDETVPNPRRNGCWHNIGTTRMAATPEEGVVDTNCRIFGMRNLSVAGSSVLPTPGAASITLTLVALSLRLADHLDRSLAATRRS